MVSTLQMGMVDLKRLIGRTTGFPTLPVVITQMLQVLNHPRSSAADVALVLKRDQALTSDLLRLVNSAAYGLGRPVDSVDEAIALTGCNTVKSLCLGVAMMDAFQLKAFQLESFWRHTIATSTAAKFLAEQTGCQAQAELVATLGLIHDIGKLVFVTELPVPYFQVTQAVKARRDISLYVEQELLGVDHCQAGVLLAQRWGWPRVYQDAMAFHHEPQRAPAASRLPVGLTYLGNLAAHLVYDPEYQGATLAHILQPCSFMPPVSASLWQACLAFLQAQQAETESFVKAMT